MRKVTTFAVAVLLATGITAAPASAATPAVGAKCAVKLAVVKAGTAKLYCGKNTNARTKAKYKLAWKKSSDCYDLIVAFNDANPLYEKGLKQSADAKAYIASMDSVTASTEAVALMKNEIAIADAQLIVAGGTIQSIKSTLALGCS